ncbi:MAG: hypothetical protein AAGI01_08025, partial [Myxococcota bacterium]
KRTSSVSSIVLMTSFLCACSSEPAEEEIVEVPEIGPFANITAITFDPEGALYVADSDSGEVTAIDVSQEIESGEMVAYNLQNLDATLSELLGAPSADLRVKDLAVHPQSNEAFLAVSRLHDGEYASGIVIVNQAGQARLLDEPATGARLTIPFAPTDDFTFYGEFPSRDLSFTDLEVHNGRLFVAGMSNADFASTLWTSELPLGGEPTVTTTEIYHAIHGQMETRAPIRALTIANLGGVDHVVAAYTCTPLVVFPVDELLSGGAVTGKTVGELGYGNTPGDMVSIQIMGQDGSPLDAIYIQNKNQGGQMIVKPALEAAAAGPGLTAPLMVGAKEDLGALETPMTSLLQLADQDPRRVLGLRRDAEDGTLELVSFTKGVFFRLSDFQSEYEIPGYTYPPEQEPIKQFQNGMKVEEGHANYVVE